MSAISEMKAYLISRKSALMADYQNDARHTWNIFEPTLEEERDRLIKSARTNAAMDEVDLALAKLDKFATHSFTE